MKKMRKGFTLVELLIVIAILGALASMMTLSGTNATASASATKIVENLLTLKSAALMMYTDYIYSGDAGFNNDSFKAVSQDYLDPVALKAMSKDYSVVVDSSTPKKWYAIYLFDANDAGTTQVKKLLKARANKLGLLKATALETAPTTEEDFDGVDATTAISIRVR